MRRLRRTAAKQASAALGLATIAFVAMGPTGSALAAASAGASQHCDDYGHCVTGTAFSSNGGVSLEKSQDSTTGAAIAVCKGGANGAVLLEVTCSVGPQSQTMSFPGTVGAVPLATDTATLERVLVCWTVVGYFPNPTGEPYEVSTAGCALLAL